MSMETENEAVLQKKTFEKGTVIFHEGKWEMWMYHIVSGKVSIYDAYGTENEKLLTELAPGKYFGELGLVEFRTRSATAVAAEDTECELIDSDALGRYLQHDTEKALEVWRNTSARIRELSKQYTDACDAIGEYLDEKEGKSSGKPGIMNFIRQMIEESRKYDSMVYQPTDIYYEMARMRGMYL